MALTSLAVTRFGNVPINRQMQTWSATAPPSNYLEQLHRWTVFHGIRTGTAALSFLLALSAECCAIMGTTEKGVCLTSTKSAVVTGANKGISREVARRLAALGFKV
jgi:hypothetical protein